MAKVTRASRSNSKIDQALQGADPGWTRDIPFGFLSRAFPWRIGPEGPTTDLGEGNPLMVTPARESGRGRGTPVFDVYHPDPFGYGVEVGLSFKVDHEARNPRGATISTQKPEMLAGILLSARQGILGSLPIWCYNRKNDGSWWACRFDAAPLLRRHLPTLTAKWADHPERADECRAIIEPIVGRRLPMVGVDVGTRGNVLMLSVARRPSGGTFRYYFSLRVNFKPAGLTWVPCDGPDVPASLGELTDADHDMIVG